MAIDNLGVQSSTGLRLVENQNFAVDAHASTLSNAYATDCLGDGLRTDALLLSCVASAGCWYLLYKIGQLLALLPDTLICFIAS